MTLPGDRDLAWWLSRDGQTTAAEHFANLFRHRYPAAALTAPESPFDAGELLDDVEVAWTDTRPPGACSLGGTYDPELNPPRLRIAVSSSGRRDGFTLLHEVCHHLMYTDPAWSLTVLPGIPADKRHMLAEMVANSFAAGILLPAATVNPTFAGGVTAAAIRALCEGSEASATACCVRALHAPGDRLVLFTDLDGKPWYSGSTGIPYNPGKRITQPSVARAVAAAQDSASGTARIVGAEGIRYSTGTTDTDVVVDVALRGGGVFVVVTRAPHDDRLRAAGQSGEVECPQCDATFTVADAVRQCQTCGLWACPECGGCECEQASVVCELCFLTLPDALARAGATRHDECP
ncbi:ImmA/IrrE family metallo-endopeptidase [Luteimicrobium sp. NPDC057192]|uniref:ImmA/IrrE family metallo-endopeptidase n=1 Tax=Luteimicrobium sp. NPDC057192 TaxID=3346042 RepID=UPI00363EAEEE